MDEETLVGLAKAGSSAAFGQLVDLRQSWLRNFLRRLCRDAALADDLSQQVLLSAWKGMDKLRSNRAFHSWLKRLAVNAWLKHVRVRRPLDFAEPPPDEDFGVLAQQQAEPVGEAMDLDRALAVLRPDVRLCVVLAHGEGMSHGEIAEMAGLPLGTVKSHINRGTTALRRILAIYGDNR